ncbi:hypothetical protein TD95_002925 [Thielaviopsis punctulata]|uniref:Protein FYV10 n=1 Tax=Thielaviopsis punctulata TaxID=72032 RepID=A0A0F4Z8F4_9PEZI|nr:hypothetical protein TD95_002925 [Thielaviopsis punctulata]
MADHNNIAIKHADHLLLEQQLVRLPYELLRKNFRSAHFAIEKENANLRSAAESAAKAAMRQTADKQATLQSLDTMIEQAEALKRKLNDFVAEEEKIATNLEKRLDYMGAIYNMNTYEDVGYESWSRTRLDRLMVEYMLQQGFIESGLALARSREIEHLIDAEPFLQCNKIIESLRNHSVTEALAWCSENKKELRKMSCNLEFMLRYQQYIELLRGGNPARFNKAIFHARKYILPMRDTYPAEVLQACGLIAFRPDPASPSTENSPIWSATRWDTLVAIFRKAFHEFFGIHDRPLLHVALSAGLSALKTPACQQKRGKPPAAQQKSEIELLEERLLGTSSEDTASSTPGIRFQLGPDYLNMTYVEGYGARELLCPICSPELSDLAAPMPYANHTRSHIDHDAVRLPTGNVFSKQKLLDFAKKARLPEGKIKDLRSGSVFDVSEMGKVFIT